LGATGKSISNGYGFDIVMCWNYGGGYVLVPPSKALKFKYFSVPFPPHHYTEKIKSQKEITNWEQQHSFHYEHQM
jgi:hypothetical protein